MPPGGRERLAEVCADADDETLADFVAAVCAARGQQVRRVDGPAFTRSTGDGAERVAVAGTPAAEAADTLVTAGRRRPPDDAETVDLDRLWTWLRYAVGDETATELLTERFGEAVVAEGTDEDGREPPAEPQPRDGRQPTAHRGAQTTERTGSGSTRRSARPDERLFRAVDAAVTPRRLRAGAIVVAALVVAVAALTVWGAPPGAPTGGTGLGAEPGTAELTPVETVATPTPADTAHGERPGQPATLPPGVGPDGITDAMRLANAHEAQVGPQSFRATLVYREFENGRTVGTSIQTVRVANDTRYRASRTDLGDVAGDVPGLVRDDVYANGSTRVVRTSAGLQRERLENDSPYVDRIEQFHRWYLSVEASRITNQTTESGITSTWLHVDGDSWVGVEELRGTVLVTETGAVTLVRRSYRDPDTGRRVVVTLRVADVGSTTVAPPTWLR
ncbi:hypothetical protein [Haloarcula litorea]|uniref:hypothetical protein n=1 Tax=Haloarcula litorea TaxID=3032579 RepID=UPI0023E7E6FC|nr:hypothetical protein [Halomicroarcula sp. GDY20]